jgi:uncharacterized iron-regulated membrane protein
MPPRLRKVLFWTHLIAGLSISLPIFVLCLTGFLMTYQRQMETWMDFRNVKSHRPAPDAQTLDVEGLIRKIHEARGMDPEAITVFSDNALPVEVQLGGKPPLVLYVDAYSGTILGEPSAKIRLVFRKIMAWHLALGVSGAPHERFRALVNATNMAALLLVVFGVILWIPRRWTWQHLRPIVMFRSGVSGRARDFNWHNVIGIWSAVPLLITVWTGMALSYRWARQSTERVIDAANQEWLERHAAGQTAFVAEFATPENAPAETPPASLSSLLSRAKAQTPGWKAIKMLVPVRDSKRVYFTIDMSGDGIRRISALGLDRGGRVVSFVPAGTGWFSSTTFIRYGHTGEAWGVAGQTIAGAASLGGAVMVWTGLALSVRRLRSWFCRKALSRKAAPANKNDEHRS